MPRKGELTYFIQKVDGKLPELEYKYRAGQEESLDGFWLNAPAGRYTCEVKKTPKEKTHKQCGAIFGVAINNIIAQANDLGIDVSYLLKYLVADNIPKGQGLTQDFIHELMYVICPTTSDDGKRVTLSKMNTVQATNLYKGLQNIFAPLGIVIPDPDPNWFKNEKESAK
ncbi:MAG: hypothetical protein WC356_02910 [Candidatus Micrarchaeia archaeon]|jgi:hypothetical protein